MWCLIVSIPDLCLLSYFANLIENGPREVFGGITKTVLEVILTPSSKTVTSIVNAYMKDVTVNVSIPSFGNCLRNSDIQFSKVHRLIYTDSKEAYANR